MAVRFKQHTGHGVVAATGLAKVLSGDLGDLTLAVGPPRYQRRTNTLFLPGIPAGDIPRDVEVQLLAYLSHEAWERRWGFWDPADPRWANRPGLKGLMNGVNDARVDYLGSKEYPGAGLHLRTLLQRDLAVFVRNTEKGRIGPTIRNMAVLTRYVGERIATPEDLWHALPSYRTFMAAVGDLWSALGAETWEEDRTEHYAFALYAILRGVRVEGGPRSRPNLPEGVEPVFKAPTLPEEGQGDHDTERETLTRIVDRMFPGQDLTKAPSKFHDDRPQVYTFDPSEDKVYYPTIRGAEPLDRSLYEKQAHALILRTRQALAANLPLPRRRQTSGRLDRRELHRLVAGASDVLQRRVRTEAMSTATAWSWDESWSMRRERIQQVRLLAYAANEAMGRLRIPTMLLGWTTQHRKLLGNWNVYRQEALRHRVYKEYDERWDDPKVLKRLAKIDVEDGTPTGEALLFAAERLSRRPERRKLLFFLTDGEPAVQAHGPESVHINFIRTVLQRSAAAGIEVIGLGIKADLSGLFPRWARVDDVAELFDATTDELVKVLRR